MCFAINSIVSATAKERPISCLLTAQAQNAVRKFLLSWHIKPTKTRTYSLIYYFYLSIWLLARGPGWSAPLYNLCCDSFLLICTSLLLKVGTMCSLPIVLLWPIIKTLVDGSANQITTFALASILVEFFL